MKYFAAIVSIMFPYFLFAAEPPACTDITQAMRYRIQISLGDRTDLFACASHAGTEAFTVKLDKDLKPIPTQLVAASPEEHVEIYRPLPTGDTKLVLAWYLNYDKDHAVGQKEIKCKGSTCSVKTSKCLLQKKKLHSLKKSLGKKNQATGVEGEEVEMENDSSESVLKEFKC